MPSVLSKAFWGGVWGGVLAPLLSSLRGRAYWVGWIVVGAVALPLVAFFLVPSIKGQPIPELWPRFPVAMMINGFWGFGTALSSAAHRRRPKGVRCARSAFAVGRAEDVGLRRHYHLIEVLGEHRRGEEGDGAQRLLARVLKVMAEQRRQHEDAAGPNRQVLPSSR